MKIGILTGGGDVPGLNPAIKSVVYRAIDDGHQVFGFRRGWAGLLNFDVNAEDNSEWFLPLTKNIVRCIDRTGGTFLHSSRTNPSNVRAGDVPDFLRDEKYHADQPPKDFTPHVMEVISHLGITVLIAIGGDDTLSYANRLHREGIQVIAIPKTMDNDVFGTEYCIGFGTSVQRSVEFITDMRSTVGSHERILVVELFGRYSGETSLVTSYLAGVDRAVISEVPFDPDVLADYLVKDRAVNPSNYAIVTVSEGARMIDADIIVSGEADAYGHKKLGGIGQQTADYIKKRTGIGIMYQQIGYLMRCGAPNIMDLMVGFNFGNYAMDLVNNRQSGRMVALQNGVYTDIEIPNTGLKKRQVDIDMLYDVTQYRPKVGSVKGMPLFLK